jgi:hypothetical protein
MRFFLGVLGLLGLLAMQPAHAADVSGTWKGAFEFQGASVPLAFHLSVAGSEVKGVIEGTPVSAIEIHDGKLDGNTITFWVNIDHPGQPVKLIYKGTLSASGDEIAFTFGTDDGGWSAQLTVKKSREDAASAATPKAAAAAVDVSGTWKGAFEFQGASMPQVLYIKSAGGAVTGTVEGLPTGPAEIHDGKLDGDTVSFWIGADYQGQSYKVLYKGKISAGQIVFTLGTDDGGWSVQLTVDKTE